WSPSERAGSTLRPSRCGRSCAEKASLIDDGDGASPAGRSSVDLHREATDRKTLRRQLVEIVQLLDVAVADLAAGAVALPDQAGVVGLGVLCLGMDERRVPAPTVDAGDPDAALQQIERCFAAHAASPRYIVGLAECCPGAGVDHHDIERREHMADALQF